LDDHASGAFFRRPRGWTARERASRRVALFLFPCHQRVARTPPAAPIPAPC